MNLQSLVGVLIGIAVFLFFSFLSTYYDGERCLEL